VDGYKLPSRFDCRTYKPFRASGVLDGRPTLKYTSALTVARAYCDHEAEALAQSGDEPLALPLTDREAKTLRYAGRAALW
jgi:hypothetical protein